MISLRLLKPTGNYLKKKADINLTKGVLCFVGLAVLFLTSIDVLPFYVDVGRYENARGLMEGLFLVSFYYYILLQYSKFSKGLVGERRVTEVLSFALNDEYSLFNDINLENKKGGNIDHTVVGPTGIFVIETKNVKGRVSYYGDDWEGAGRRSPSKQARINAMRIRNILVSPSPESRPVWVQGIVALTNPRVNVIAKKPPEYVKVFKINELTNYIRNEPRRLEAWQIENIETEIKNRTQTRS